MGGIERAEPTQPNNQALWPQHVKRALAYMRANMADRISPCVRLVRVLARTYRTPLMPGELNKGRLKCETCY